MIMLEITNNMRMLVPLIVTIMVSKIIADSIAHGVNHQVLHLNPYVHLLEDALSEDQLLVLEGLTVHDACVSEVVVLHETEPIGQITTLLEATTFEGYPVIDSHNRLIGVVTRVQLAKALINYNSVKSTFFDIAAMCCTDPDITLWTMPLSRAFHHFRSSGLQRLCVVDETHELIGILTRTDFSRLGKPGHEGVEEIRSLINRKHARAAAGLSRKVEPNISEHDAWNETSPQSPSLLDEQSCSEKSRCSLTFHIPEGDEVVPEDTPSVNSSSRRVTDEQTVHSTRGDGGERVHAISSHAGTRPPISSYFEHREGHDAAQSEADLAVNCRQEVASSDSSAGDHP
jgi:CBS domain-containing protein